MVADKKYLGLLLFEYSRHFNARRGKNELAKSYYSKATWEMNEKAGNQSNLIQTQIYTG